MKANRRTALQIVWANLIAKKDKGATSDELEKLTGLTHQTVSARLNELQYDYRAAYITGAKRLTRSGRPASVYFAF